MAGRLGRLLRNGLGALALSLCFLGEALAEQPVFASLTLLEPPTSGIAQEPYLAVVGQSLLISWMVPTASETLVQFARFDDVGWSKPVTVGRGEDVFVNWADFPTVAAFGDSGIALKIERRIGDEVQQGEPLGRLFLRREDNDLEERFTACFEVEDEASSSQLIHGRIPA